MPHFRDPEDLLVRTDSGCITGQVFHELSCDCRQQLHQAMTDVTRRGEGIIVHIPGQDGRGMGLDFKLATLHIQQRLGADTVQAACIIRFMMQVHESISELSRMAEFDQVQDVARRAIDIENEAEQLWDTGREELAMGILDSVQADIALILQDTRKKLNISDIDQRTYEGVIAILQTLGVQPDVAVINMATNNPQKMQVFERNGYLIQKTPVIASNAVQIYQHLQAKERHLGHQIGAHMPTVLPQAG
jgi:GTP cyclohydrolase II